MSAFVTQRSREKPLLYLRILPSDNNTGSKIVVFGGPAMIDESPGFDVHVSSLSTALTDDRLETAPRSVARAHTSHTYAAPQAVMTSRSPRDTNDGILPSTVVAPTSSSGHDQRSNGARSYPSPSSPARKPVSPPSQTEHDRGVEQQAVAPPARPTQSRELPAAPVFRSPPASHHRLESMKIAQHDPDSNPFTWTQVAATPAQPAAASLHQRLSPVERHELPATPPHQGQPSNIRIQEEAFTPTNTPLSPGQVSPLATSDTTRNHSASSAGSSGQLPPLAGETEGSQATTSTQLPSSASHTRTSATTTHGLSQQNRGPLSILDTNLQSSNSAAEQASADVRSPEHSRVIAMKSRQSGQVEIGQVIETPRKAWYEENPCPVCKTDLPNALMRMDWLRYSWGEKNKCSTCKQIRRSFPSLSVAVCRTEESLAKLDYSFPISQVKEMFKHLEANWRLCKPQQKRKRKRKTTNGCQNDQRKAHRTTRTSAPTESSTQDFIVIDDDGSSGSGDEYVESDSEANDLMLTFMGASPRTTRQQATQGAEQSIMEPTTQQSDDDESAAASPGPSTDSTEREHRAQHANGSAATTAVSADHIGANDEDTAMLNDITEILRTASNRSSNPSFLQLQEVIRHHKQMKADYREQGARIQEKREQYADERANLRRQQQDLARDLNEAKRQMDEAKRRIESFEKSSTVVDDRLDEIQQGCLRLDEEEDQRQNSMNACGLNWSDG